MSRDPHTVRPDACGEDAARIMWERRCGFVPVVDAAGSLVGAVTDRDLCMAAYLRAVSLSHFRVDSVMSRGVHTCRVTDSAEVAERIMTEAQVRRLPVMDERGSLVGIVSLGDLARAPGTAQPTRAAEHVPSGIARVLAAISRPPVEAPGAPSASPPHGNTTPTERRRGERRRASRSGPRT